MYGVNSFETLALYGQLQVEIGSILELLQSLRKHDSFYLINLIRLRRHFTSLYAMGWEGDLAIACVLDFNWQPHRNSDTSNPSTPYLKVQSTK